MLLQLIFLSFDSIILKDSIFFFLLKKDKESIVGKYFIQPVLEK